MNLRQSRQSNLRRPLQQNPQRLLKHHRHPQMERQQSRRQWMTASFRSDYQPASAACSSASVG